MEIGLREWLIVGAIIVILLIVIDGWRRMRAQSNSLKIDIDDKLADLGDDCYNPELPLGTARVFKPKDDEVGTSAEIASSNANGVVMSGPEHENNVEHPQPQLSNENTALNSISTNPSVSDETEVVSPVTSAQSQYSDNQQSNDDEATASRAANTSTHSVDLGFTALDTEMDEPVAASKYSLDNTTDIVDKTSKGVDTDSNGTTQTRNTKIDDSFSSDETPSVSAAKDNFVVPDILKKTLSNSEALITEVSQSVLTSSSGSTTETNSEVVLEQTESEEMIEESQSSTSEIDVKLEDEFDRFSDDSDFDDNVADNDILSVGVPVSRVQERPELVIEEQKKQADSPLGINPTSIPVEESIPDEAAQPIEAELSVIEQIANKRVENTRLENQQADNSKVDNHQIDQAALIQSDSQSSVIAQSVEELEQTNAETVESSEDSRSSEIELLKARLRELSEEALVDKTTQQADEDTLAAPSVNTHNANDLNELDQNQVIEKQVSANESGSDQNDSYQKTEQPEIVQDQSIASNVDAYTTVIDDDVSLEELAKELTQLPLDSAEMRFQQSDYQDKSHSEKDIESKKNKESAAEIAVDFEDQQRSSLAFSATGDEVNDVAIEPLEEADPLLDNFLNQQASQQLMSQFEEDLETADKVVANELDMPITEILKNATPLAELTANQLDKDDSDDKPLVDEPIEIQGDPLLDGIGLSEQLLSGDDFDDEIEPLEEPETLNESDNLGFTALEQGYEEPAVTGKSDEPKAFGDVQQESLFKEMPEVVASTAKKPRKVMTGSGDPDSVLIVTVVAKDHDLDGGGLKQIVEACGMEFGDMDVFHRFEDGADQGAVQFSMANAIKPGTFMLDEMDTTSTPGVSFFMSMNEPLDPKNALECMLATAETVANNLNGNLLDDDKSVLRPQTKEHYRERVRVHEMNKLRRRAH
jgi:cell division protein ZipA